MTTASHRNLAERWYAALAAGDLDTFVALHAPDCVYNISGHTPISGQVRGIANLMEHVVPLVFGGLDMTRMRFCTRHAVVCADESRAVGIMEADGPAQNGVRYDQRYVHMFMARDGQLVAVWEFFDTALAESALFPNPALQVPAVDRDGFSIEAPGS